MKRGFFLKKLVLVLFLIPIFIASTTISTYADTISKNGITVEISSSKAEYAKDEEIPVKIDIRNENEFRISNVKIQSVIPDGLSLRKDTSGDEVIPELKPGESKTFSIRLIYSGKDSASETQEKSVTVTGNTRNGIIILCSVVLLMSIVGVITVLKAKSKIKKFLSLFICIIITATMVVIVNIKYFRVDQDNDNTITSSCRVKVGDSSYKIGVNVKYNIPNSNENCVVTFDSNGGSEVKPQTVKAGEKAEMPDNPSKEGYTFLGWYTSNEFDESINFDELFEFDETSITEDITLYAKWVISDPEQADLDFAYNTLTIGYSAGDSSESVTQDITLSKNSDSVSVSWKSSDENIISDEGKVIRPQEENVSVTMTATLKIGEKSATKTFILTVIRNKELNISDIKDNSIDEITKINDGKKPEIHKNDDGNIIFIDSKYTDIEIETAEDAKTSLYSIKSLMNINDPEREFKCIGCNTGETINNFSFDQYYKGCRVYGRTLTVVTDNNKNAIGITTSYLPNIGDVEECVITKEEAIEAVKKYLDNEDITVNSCEVVVYTDGEKPVKAYDLMIGLNTILINGVTGEVITSDSMCNTADDYELTMKDEMNQERTVPVIAYEPFYMFRDVERGIWLYKYNLENYTDKIECGDPNVYHGYSKRNIYRIYYTDTLDEEELIVARRAVSAYANVEDVYDWYKNKFQYKGLNGVGSAFDVSFDATYPVYKNGKLIGWAVNNSRSYPGESIGQPYRDGITSLLNTSDDSDKCNTLSCKDVMAHEYGHRVFHTKTHYRVPSKNLPGAINEGYADSFACLFDGNWTIAEEREVWRDAENPEKYKKPSKIGGKYYYNDFTEDAEDKGGVHTNLTILSHAVYLMNEKYGISKEKLGKVLFNSIYGYDSHTEFENVKYNMVFAGKNLKLSEDELNGIRSAFSDVGVSDDSGFAGGDGSIDNPYLVSTPNQLNNVRSDLTAHYKQICDIDMKDFGNWEPIAYANTEAYDDKAFNGTYDGGGYKILNLTIDKGEEAVKGGGCIGLFSDCTLGVYSVDNKECYLSNINLENINININTDKNNAGDDALEEFSFIYVGGIVGRAGVPVTNCTVSGNINVDNCLNAGVGGIVGLLLSQATECTNNANINVVSNRKALDKRSGSIENSKGQIRCGGISGESIISDGALEGCTNNGTIKGKSTCSLECGGISGYCGEFKKCCNTASIEGSVVSDLLASTTWYCGCSCGGICGTMHDADEVYECYNKGSINAYFENTLDYYTQSADVYAGGIVGSCFWSLTCKIQGCYNYSGDLTAKFKYHYDNKIIDKNVGRIIGIRLSPEYLIENYADANIKVNGRIVPESETGTNTLHGANIIP